MALSKKLNQLHFFKIQKRDIYVLYIVEQNIQIFSACGR